MPKKTIPITDIKDPGQVKPSASARPVVVGGRPMIAGDPMMVRADEQTATSVPSTAPEVSRTAKTLQPAHDLTEEADTGTDTEAPAAAPAQPPAAEAVTDPAAPAESIGAEAEAQPQTPAEADSVVSKAEAEARQREAETQKLIDSRQFYVPINTIEQKRSVHTSVWLTLLVIVLAAILVDIMLDANVIVLLTKLPHTHFFAPQPHF